MTSGTRRAASRSTTTRRSSSRHGSIAGVPSVLLVPDRPVLLDDRLGQRPQQPQPAPGGDRCRRRAARRGVDRSDPGVRNWLDTTGHDVRRPAVPVVGYRVGTGALGAEDGGRPLADDLPSTVARVRPRRAPRRSSRARSACNCAPAGSTPAVCVTLGFPSGAFVGSCRRARRGLHRSSRAGQRSGRPTVPGRKVAEMGGERAAYDATSAVDGRALWRRVVSVAEGRARVRSRRARFAIGHGVPVRAVHREFTAWSVNSHAGSVQSAIERAGAVRGPSGSSVPPHRGVARARLSARLTCRRLASEGASATRPVAVAYVGSAPTCGADPCEKEHST